MAPRAIDAPRGRFDHAPMTFKRLLPFLLAWLVLPCFAQQAPDPAAKAQQPDVAATPEGARQQTADIRKELGNGDIDDARLGEFREIANTLAAQADTLLADRAPKLAAVQAQLDELGPVPPKGSNEAPDIAAQRVDLTKQAAALEAEIKRAKLMALDSQQLSAQITEARRTSFQERLSQRTASPLTPTFWRGIGANAERDTARIAALRDGLVVALRDAFTQENRPFAFIGLALGLALFAIGRWWAARALMRLTAGRVPQGRLRRSAFALALVAVATVFTGGGVQIAMLGLNWHGAFGGAESQLASTVVGAAYFGGFVSGLGYALLSPIRPSWRLPAIPDLIASRLRFAPVLFGIAVVQSIVLHRLASIAGTSVTITIVASLATALIYGVLIVWALTRCGVVRPRDGQAAAARPAWLGAVIAAYWLGALVTIVAALLGFIALASQIARQMMWLLIVSGTLYLLVRVLEDFSANLLSSRAEWAQRTLGLEERTLDQLSVLLSGVFRVLVFIAALVVAFAPFTQPSDLLARGARLSDTIKLGQVVITPTAVVVALLVFFVGWLVVRSLTRWLGDRFLPTTRMDSGMRNSITTLIGYVGVVVVVALTLSALGLSLERIAWVASALSVGIGFGLQAIVQNFVSGLILLAERPVKAGDLIVLGDTEGDIRRINVRATEIQLSDRSTLIVPNSELITKSVRNVTLANAEGRVQFRLPLPLNVDPHLVRELLFAAVRAHPGVLEKPAPSVIIEGIQGATVVFVTTAFVASPRQIGSVRSDILFDLLARLRAADIGLSVPYEVKLRDDSASLPTDPA